MTKYPKIIKEVKARTSHQCEKCGNIIKREEFYYREHIEDKFLHSLHAKKYCSFCYEKYGDKLLQMRFYRKQEKENENQMTFGF